MKKEIKLLIQIIVLLIITGLSFYFLILNSPKTDIPQNWENNGDITTSEYWNLPDEEVKKIDTLLITNEDNKIKEIEEMFKIEKRDEHKIYRAIITLSKYDSNKAQEFCEKIESEKIKKLCIEDIN